MPKLRAIFTPAELADIAATGRAAIHPNSLVPGTFNSSNTASAALSNDMARRMMASVHAAHGKASGGAGVHAGDRAAARVAANARNVRLAEGLRSHAAARRASGARARPSSHRISASGSRTDCAERRRPEAERPKSVRLGMFGAGR